MLMTSPSFTADIADGEVLLVLVDVQRAAAGNAAGAHAAGDNSRVAGTAASGGQDALGDGHALDILGAGEVADEEDGAVLGVLLDFLGGEVHRAAAGAGAGGQAGGHGGGSLQGSLVKAGVQQGVDGVGVNLQQGLFLGAEPFALTMSTATLKAACAVRLPLRVWSM